MIKRTMLVYTSIPPTHAFVLQLMPMDIGAKLKSCKIAERLLDMHKYDKSQMVHSIVFKCHKWKMILTLMFKVVSFRIHGRYLRVLKGVILITMISVFIKYTVGRYFYMRISYPSPYNMYFGNIMF